MVHTEIENVMQDEKELKNMNNFSSNLEIGCFNEFQLTIKLKFLKNRNTSIS